MFPSIPRFVSGSTDGGIESKGPTSNPVTAFFFAPNGILTRAYTRDKMHTPVSV